MIYITQFNKCTTMKNWKKYQKNPVLCCYAQRLTYILLNNKWKIILCYHHHTILAAILNSFKATVVYNHSTSSAAVLKTISWMINGCSKTHIKIEEENEISFWFFSQLWGIKIEKSHSQGRERSSPFQSLIPCLQKNHLKFKFFQISKWWKGLQTKTPLTSFLPSREQTHFSTGNWTMIDLLSFKKRFRTDAKIEGR